MSSAGIQELFCGIYSAFKCSFDEFVGEKVFSLSYSSTILAPPFFTLSNERENLELIIVEITAVNGTLLKKETKFHSNK